MATTCEQIGHDYQATTASGWFRCARIATYTKKSVPVLCNAVAVCPGCLGYAIAGMDNVFCVTHYQVCTLEDFPVVDSVISDAHTVDTSSYDQVSLWSDL